MGFVEDGGLTAVFCICAPLLGFIFSFIYAKQTANIILDPSKLMEQDKAPLVLNEDITSKQATTVWEVHGLIDRGARAFLWAEYKYVGVFVGIFSIVLFFILGISQHKKDDPGIRDPWADSAFTVISFLVGALTSIISGYIGMRIGVFANARTAVMCRGSLAEGFITSFKAAIVMGFCLCSFGIINLYILICIFRCYWTRAFNIDKSNSALETEALFEAIAGYGLGGSTIALFGRVGGGIYTKAADVGADLVGKVEAQIPEDDPRNPAVIADNVGDNVGDIAGMGADLFGSFAEATCAALVIGSQSGGDEKGTDSYNSHGFWHQWGRVSFPLIISSTGIFVCFLTSFVATHIAPPKRLNDIESVVKKQLLISTILMTCALIGICYLFLPNEMYFSPHKQHIHPWHIFLCGGAGLWSGLAIGYITEYYTSNKQAPVQELADSCNTGAATNIIIGLALGYKSVIIPIIALCLTSFIAHELAGFYGVSIAALGILSTLAIGLTIDAFGPISDNAGGIAEMSELGEETRNRTDALDAAGNTTAAIGKGFAIGSAAFVSLALFSGYVTIIKTRNSDALTHVDILKAFPFAGLLYGAMLPYWFSALTMKSVGKAALEMVKEVREQFRNNPGILKNESKPDYERCIRISTEASLKEMFAPGALVMLTPIIVGFLFGVECLAGVLVGALVSGVQIAISASNTGGAWDNAKKYIEQGALGENKGKGSDVHKAAVVGDTVGDPLKDTSGPSLNILIKLMAIISLVFARAYPLCDGGYLGKLYRAMS